MSRNKEVQRSNVLVNYYISSHGFGHCSRAIPIIKFLQKKEFVIRVISGEKQIVFLKESLGNKNILYNIKTTDIGWIFKRDGVTLDYDNLIHSLKVWLNSSQDLVEYEVRTIEQTNSYGIIISDISPLGFAVAHKLNIYSIGISNFTWIEQYENAGLPKDIVEQFRKYYSYCDLYLRVPFNTPQFIGKEHRDVGYIVRNYNADIVKEIRHNALKTGVKIIIFLGVGGSLSIDKEFEFDNNVLVFYGLGVKVKAKHKFYIGDREDVQNYIAASDIAIIKPGWSTVMECVNAKIPMVVIKRDNIYEDECISKEIESKGLGIVLEIGKLNKLSLNTLETIIYRTKNNNLPNYFKTFDLNDLLDIINKNIHKGAII